MKGDDKAQAQLLSELAELRRRVTELEASEAERQRAQQALRESEERFRQVFENSGEGIAITTLDGSRIIQANKAFCGMLGYTEEEITRLSFTDVVQPGDLETDRDNLSKLRRDQIERVRMEKRLVTKDRRIVWVYLTGTVIRDSGGKPLHVLGILTNITERKQIEERVHRLNEDLERRAEELMALNAAGQALSSTLDLDTLLELVISQVRSMLYAEAASVLLRAPVQVPDGDELVIVAAAGPRSEELVGTRLPASAGIAGWVMRMRYPTLVQDAQNDPRFDKRIDAMTGLTSRSIVSVPLIFAGVTQGVIEATNKASESPLASGAFDEHDLEMLQALAGSAAKAIENARLYQVEREQFRRLQESQAQLVQVEKMAALGRLVASLAHEINNPLQALQSSLELAKEELEGGLRREKLARYLGMAGSEIERLSTTVRRMRDFGRPAREGLQPTDVNAVLQSVLELAGRQLQHSHIAVERQGLVGTGGLLMIQANPDYLKQVFLNLVLNAIDAMAAQGGGTLRVRTALDQMHGSDDWPLPAARIEFSDTGEGIPPEILSHVFEPFVTTKKTGMGLGLSISYGLVEAHNGRITVTSQVGVGTTFIILLPVGATTPAPPTSPRHFL